MIDYVAVDEKLRKDILDARRARGMFDGLDHYAVSDKTLIQLSWTE